MRKRSTTNYSRRTWICMVVVRDYNNDDDDAMIYRQLTQLGWNLEFRVGNGCFQQDMIIMSTNHIIFRKDTAKRKTTKITHKFKKNLCCSTWWQRPPGSYACVLIITNSYLRLNPAGRSSRSLFSRSTRLGLQGMRNGSLVGEKTPGLTGNQGNGYHWPAWGLLFRQRQFLQTRSFRAPWPPPACTTGDTQERKTKKKREKKECTTPWTTPSDSFQQRFVPY